MAFQETAVQNLIEISRYSKRVVLKSLLERSDGGVSLVGEKIVIGGWVKSAKKVMNEPPPPPPPPAVAEQAVTEQAEGRPKDLSCCEILVNWVPIIWCFKKASRASSRLDKEKSTDGLRELLPLPPTVVLQVSDGSCVDRLQVVVDSSIAHSEQTMLRGTSILVEGVLQLSSVAGKSVIELKAEKILHLGVVDHAKYPLSKTRIPFDTLWDWAHFRPRTTTVASITRIGNALTRATHTFFQNNGFLFVQVPVITAVDSEGQSEKFHVTTLFGRPTKEEMQSGVNDGRDIVSLDSIKASIKDKSNRIEELKRSNSNEEALIAAVQDLQKTKEIALQLEAKEKAKAATSSKSTVFSFSDDYFSCQAYLTVSGRLHLESYACAVGQVYSFGPRFKAETKQSAKRVAEMWMVEAEIAFAEEQEAMSCATDFLKFLCKWVLENCSQDMKFVVKRIDKTVADGLRSVESAKFEVISYAEAIYALKQVSERKFDAAIEDGLPLTQEHESYLADEIYKSPVIIHKYPKQLKPFYVRVNDDGETVAAFDVVIPKVGAVIRGSQNEERFSILSNRINELGLPSEKYEWYLDLRRHGTVKHAGFSLGFDLMVLLATGVTDVRNVIPFSRSYRILNN
ncbi:hypothetical protein Nepgr_027663 [Nepenthes gracilis]|uniref:asparagine--tRNA ligase n=1 Tax=Nepenthes gracilis TaxID=150966 RepID=A0AAD3T8Y2_NEPGR|nr:hypothetical protein Nepgr_027663 [Nepenthes gracilis]